MNLKYDGPLSNFAFNCNLRRYTTEEEKAWPYPTTVGQCRLTPGFCSRPQLAFRNFQRLKLKYDELLSSFAINCKLRHYSVGFVVQGLLCVALLVSARWFQLYAVCAAVGLGLVAHFDPPEW